MYKRWPILAQIIIALGCGGGLISIWAGVTQQNWLVAAFGLICTVIFWSFYQLQPWAPRAINALLIGLLISDVMTIALGMVQVVMGICVVVFRALMLFYFNSPRIKSLFEVTEESAEPS